MDVSRNSGIPSQVDTLRLGLQYHTGQTRTLQTAMLQMGFVVVFVLGNCGAGGKQEHGRELCADFFNAKKIACSVTVCSVLVLPYLPHGSTETYTKVSHQRTWGCHGIVLSLEMTSPQALEFNRHLSLHECEKGGT